MKRSSPSCVKTSVSTRSLFGYCLAFRAENWNNCFAYGTRRFTRGFPAAGEMGRWINRPYSKTVKKGQNLAGDQMLGFGTTLSSRSINTNAMFWVTENRTRYNIISSPSRYSEYPKLKIILHINRGLEEIASELPFICIKPSALSILSMVEMNMFHWANGCNF